MSWILAAYNAPVPVCETARGLVNQTPSLLFQVSNRGSFLAAGGIPDTCHFHATPSGEAGWLSVGLGLSVKPSGYHSLSTQDWHHRLRQKQPDLPRNGHFAIVTWDDNRIKAHTDALGIRTLYYVKSGAALLISTRLDWLAQISGSQQIDFKTFGSHWTSSNQLAMDAPIEGINRLGPGGRLSFSSTSFTVTQKPWTPSPAPGTQGVFEDKLKAFMKPALPNNIKLSLGLSGGMDSRLLLALSAHTQVRSLHTFGPPEKADVRAATQLAQSSTLPHTIFDEPVPSADECISLLQNHVACTQAVSSASSVLGLRYYNMLHGTGYAVVDGGFGEAARRQFLRRILFHGSAKLNNALIRGGNLKEITPLLAFSRAAIFTKEVEDVMHAGVREHFESSWSIIPDQTRLRLENALDLFSIQTRLPNFFGYEQNRLDGIVLSYMPFAQPDVLDIVFSLPLRERRGGRLFRRIIRSVAANLTGVPLVKGEYTYPFNLPTTGAFFWTKVKSKLSPAPPLVLQHQYLKQMRVFIEDTLASQAVRSYAAYDLPQIQQNVDAYFRGELRYADFIDWWLAFEVWRQEITKRIV